MSATNGFCLAVVSSLVFAAAASAQSAPPPGAAAPPPPAQAQNPPPPDDGIVPAAFDQKDASGTLGTINATGPTDKHVDDFFQPLGTNQRHCYSCHKPRDAWTITPARAQSEFNESQGLKDLFRPIDGATCPTDDVSTLEARQQAYSLLLDRGLIRIGVALPTSNLAFSVAVVSDPFGCASNPSYGLTGPTTGTVSTYRRPFPTTDLRFEVTLMWDGREPDLAHQATDAILTHEQATTPPTNAQLSQITDFESGLTTAQDTDAAAGHLDILGANGGPAYLNQIAFTPGINDSAGRNGATFNPNVFTIYSAWAGAPLTNDAAGAARTAIGRGETVFNTRQFTIRNVPGATDGAPNQTLTVTCSSCHDTPDVGNRSVADFINIGTADPQANSLNQQNLPIFAVTCTAGGATVNVTDPGRATVTGNCADVGKFKVPGLRSLAGRAPYFHNGGAAQIEDVINFYDQRFSIGLTAQEKSDLAAFLRAL